MQSSLNIENSKYDINPITNFLFALKAPETKRQYTKRLEVFLDFLNLIKYLVYLEPYDRL